jgi:hypothetical protein
MSKAYLRKIAGQYVLQTESGETVHSWGIQRPASGARARAMKLFTSEVTLVDELPPPRCRAKDGTPQ